MSFWFGCRHKNTSFPITLSRKADAVEGHSKTYIVCLECGKEMAYDWDSMKVVEGARSSEPEPEYQPAVPA